jgi:hypothetical protein
MGRSPSDKRTFDAVIAAFIPLAAFESLPGPFPRATDLRLAFSALFSTYEWTGARGCGGQPIGDPELVSEYWAHCLLEESITCLTALGILAAALFLLNSKRALRGERVAMGLAGSTLLVTCLSVGTWIAGVARLVTRIW